MRNASYPWLHAMGVRLLNRLPRQRQLPPRKQGRGPAPRLTNRIRHSLIRGGYSKPRVDNSPNNSTSCFHTARALNAPVAVEASVTPCVDPVVETAVQTAL